MNTPSLLHLQMQAAKGIGFAAQRLILNYCLENNLQLAEVFSDAFQGLRKLGFGDAKIDALQEAQTKAASWFKDFNDREIATISLLDFNYPSRLKKVLGNKAPPVLHCWGNIELLTEPSVGFCGSRSPSAMAEEMASDTASQIAKCNWVVVSGHAKGIDLVTHHTALKNAGKTIVVLPEGFLGFRLRPELKKLVNDGNTLVVSEFQPDAHWSVANAMTRNRTIAGLSDALIVIQSGVTGGTFEAGKFALQVKLPLFVVDYAEPQLNGQGNPYFIERGAKPVLLDVNKQQADLNNLVTEVQSHHEHLKRKPQINTDQMVLF